MNQWIETLAQHLLLLLWLCSGQHTCSQRFLAGHIDGLSIRNGLIDAGLSGHCLWSILLYAWILETELNLFLIYNMNIAPPRIRLH